MRSLSLAFQCSSSISMVVRSALAVLALIPCVQGLDYALPSGSQITFQSPQMVPDGSRMSQYYVVDETTNTTWIAPWGTTESHDPSAIVGTGDFSCLAASKIPSDRMFVKITNTGTTHTYAVRCWTPHNSFSYALRSTGVVQWTVPNEDVSDSLLFRFAFVDGSTLRVTPPISTPPPPTTAVATGLWHQTTYRSVDGVTSNWYYGQESTHTYDTGSANSGTLTFPPILVSGTGMLAFKQWRIAETGLSWDKSLVEISNNSGSSWIQVFQSTLYSAAWNDTTVNLASYLGQKIQIRFRFDTVDSGANAMEGWHVSAITLNGVSLDGGATSHVPVVQGKTLTTTVNVPILTSVTASDPDGDPVSLRIGTAPTKGAIAINGLNLTYTPNAGATGSDSFTLIGNDGANDSAAATFTVTITSPAPVVVGQTLSTNMNAPLQTLVSATDPDGDSVTLRLGTTPSLGSVSLIGNLLTYTPNATGTDSFTIIGNDGTYDSSPALFTVTISGPGIVSLAIPHAIGQTIIDQPRNRLYLVDTTNNLVESWNTVTGRRNRVTSLGFDAGDSYTYGGMALSLDGTILAVALPSANRIALFSVPDLTLLKTFTATSPRFLAIAADGSLYVSGTNLIRMDITTGQNLGVIDTSIYGSIHLSTNPSHTKLYGYQGLGMSGGDGQYIKIYDLTQGGIVLQSLTAPMSNAKMVLPDEDWNRVYSMNGGVYGIGSTDTSSNILSRILFSSSLSDAPYGCGIAFLPGSPYLWATSYGSLYRFARSGLTQLERYPGGASYIRDRSLQVDGQGNPWFTIGQWRGDGGGYDGSNWILKALGPSSLSLNRPPQGEAMTVKVDPSVPTTVVLPISDPEGDSFFWSAPGYSSWSSMWPWGVGGDLVVPAGVSGTVVIPVTASDALGAGDPFTITVVANVAPSADPVALVGNEDADGTAQLIATDGNGDAISATVSTPPVHGTLSLTPNATGWMLAFTPAPNWSGTDTALVTLSDGMATSVVDVSIVVTPVNDAPVAASATVTIAEGGTITQTLAASDIDGDTLTATVQTPSIHGSLVFTQLSWTYVSNVGWSGDDIIPVVVSDGTTAVQATITVQVIGAPVITVNQPQAVVRPATALLTGTAVDPRSLGVTSTWSQVSGPTPAVIASPSALSTSVSFPAEGLYRFALTSTNGFRQSVATTSVIATLPGMTVVDNGIAGFSEYGPWGPTTTNGFLGTDARAGSGSASAAWSLAGAAGWYQVDAWLVGGLADGSANAQFAVTHAGGTSRTTINLATAQSGWRTLGWFRRDAAPLRVVATATGGVLRVDAARTIALGGTIIDDGGAGFSQPTGTWAASGLLGFDNGATRYSIGGDATARWQASVVASATAYGDYRLHWWRLPHSGNLPTWSLAVDDGSGTQIPWLVEAKTGVSGWVDLGRYRPATGSLGVSLARPAGSPSGFVRADALRVAPVVVVDNSDPGYREEGIWGVSGLKGVDNSATRFSPLTGAFAAQWRAALPKGRYRVWWWRVPHTSNSLTADLAVSNDAGVTNLSVDAKAAAGWVDLGIHTITSGEGQVRATRTGSGYLRADAVRWEPLADEVPVTVPAAAGKG